MLTHPEPPGPSSRIKGWNSGSSEGHVHSSTAKMKKAAASRSKGRAKIPRGKQGFLKKADIIQREIKPALRTTYMGVSKTGDAKKENRLSSY